MRQSAKQNVNCDAVFFFFKELHYHMCFGLAAFPWSGWRKPTRQRSQDSKRRRWRQTRLIANHKPSFFSHVMFTSLCWYTYMYVCHTLTKMNAGQLPVAIVVSKSSSIPARDVLDRRALVTCTVTHFAWHHRVRRTFITFRRKTPLRPQNAVQYWCRLRRMYSCVVIFPDYAGLYVSINSILLYFSQTVIWTTILLL